MPAAKVHAVAKTVVILTAKDHIVAVALCIAALIEDTLPFYTTTPIPRKSGACIFIEYLNKNRCTIFSWT